MLQCSVQLFICALDEDIKELPEIDREWAFDKINDTRKVLLDDLGQH